MKRLPSFFFFCVITAYCPEVYLWICEGSGECGLAGWQRDAICAAVCLRPGSVATRWVPRLSLIVWRSERSQKFTTHRKWPDLTWPNLGGFSEAEWGRSRLGQMEPDWAEAHLCPLWQASTLRYLCFCLSSLSIFWCAFWLRMAGVLCFSSYYIYLICNNCKVSSP